MQPIRASITLLWNASRPLTAVGLGMLAALVASLMMMAVDPRVIAGAPAWLKPAKFAISTAIYALTLAWLFTWLPGRTRLTRIVGWGTALILVLEVALIDMQAARGATSHFNAATRFDMAVFSVMGSAIVIAWGLSIALAVALFRQTFADPALGWAIRLGMLVTVLGAGMGGLMTRPTSAQLAAARATHTMPIAGAHTVGAPDGGPGLPGTGWSREHGDLRVPHFLGLHAVQILPLAALLLARVASGERRRRAVLVAAASYASLVGILLWQALAGEPVIAPGPTTLAALAIWAAATATGFAGAMAPRLFAGSAFPPPLKLRRTHRSLGEGGQADRGPTDAGHDVEVMR
jgi:hypothetical protein